LLRFAKSFTSGPENGFLLPGDQSLQAVYSFLSGSSFHSPAPFYNLFLQHPALDSNQLPAVRPDFFAGRAIIRHNYLGLGEIA
jgi:hypothetical protein